MSKSKITSIILGLILLLILILGSTYYISFYPKTDVKSISTSSKFNGITLLDKLSSNDLNISSKKISLETSLTLSEEDITDLFIYLIKESNTKLSDILTGLKVDINDDKINLIFHAKYNGIPLEGNLIFTGKTLNGKCVLHYESGNLGFININKDLIFSKLKSNDIVDINKESGDIILGIKDLNGIEIKAFDVNNDKITITIKGILDLEDCALKKLR